MNNIGNKIRALREQKGYSQEKLAEISELHRTYIGSVERCERNVSIEAMEKIAKALGIPLYILLKENKNAKKKI